MTTSVKIKRGSGNANVLVEVVSLMSGGPTTQRSFTIDSPDQEIEVALHDGAMLHVSEQMPAAEPAPVLTMALAEPVAIQATEPSDDK